MKIDVSLLKRQKILIVDTNRVFSKKLERILGGLDPLANECNICQHFEDVPEFLKKTRYDLVFISIHIPKMNGIELIKKIKRGCNGCKIVIMTDSTDASLVYEYMDIGVTAYLLKSGMMNAMSDLIKVLVNGGTYISPELNVSNLRNIPEVHYAWVMHPLHRNITKTERKVIIKICEQKSSEQIALEMATCKSTIDTHRKRIIKKLNVINSAGIVIFAITSRLFNP